MKKRVLLVLLVLTMCMVTACGADDVKNDQGIDVQSDEEVVEGNIRKAFKKEVDDYEAFFFEYVDAMKLMLAAKDEGDVEKMMTVQDEYAELFDKYPTAMGDYMDIAERDLSEEEREYWQAASKRITVKLQEAIPQEEETE